MACSRLPDEGAVAVHFEDDQVVSPNGLWPPHFRGLKLVAPSVFSDTGWVWHELSASELGTAWDLPVKWVKGLSLDDSRDELIRGVCRAPPCKSLWAFGCTMKCFRLGEEPENAIDPWRKDNMDHRGFGIFVDDALKLEHVAVAGLEKDAERRLWEAKAVKVDDADGVPVHLWNLRNFAIFPESLGDVDPKAGKMVCNIIRERFLLQRW